MAHLDKLIDELDNLDAELVSRLRDDYVGECMEGGTKSLISKYNTFPSPDLISATFLVRIISALKEIDERLKTLENK